MVIIYSFRPDVLLLLAYVINHVPFSKHCVYGICLDFMEIISTTVISGLIKCRMY